MSKDIVGKIVKGWAVGQTVTVPYKSGPKTLHICTKTCRECGVLMRMNVARSALEGETKNNGLDYARCDDCRAGRRKPVEEPAASAPVVAGQPQDLVSQMYRDNVALIRENAELKAAAANLAAAPVPSVADQALSRSEKEELESLRKRVASAPSLAAQATTPADTAELEALRKFRLDVFRASRYVEHAPMYISAKGVKTYDLLGPEQVTNANLLAHVKEVGDTYEGMFQALGGYNNLKEGLNKVAYYKAYAIAAYNTLDTSVYDRIDSEARDEADAKYPL